MLSPKPDDFELLIEVFYAGLRYGIITVEQVTAWADGIIANTDQPDYFFIEVSLTSNKNDLIRLLDEQNADSDNPICPRVLFGLLYRQCIDKPEAVHIESVVEILYNLRWLGLLTTYETGQIYILDDYDRYGVPDLQQLRHDVINFLEIYELFTLQNYSQWGAINTRVEAVLEKRGAEEETKTKIAAEAYKKRWEKDQKKKKLQSRLRLSIPIIIGILCYAAIIWIIIKYDTRLLVPVAGALLVMFYNAVTTYIDNN